MVTPIRFHVVVGSIFAVTAAIEYARTGRPNPLGPHLSTNTALALSILAFISGQWNFTRPGWHSPLVVGLAFCTLYFVSFVRLQAEQGYGYESALFVSILLAIGFLPRTAELIGRPLPKEYCALGMYGTVIFGNGIHFCLGLGLSLSLVLCAASDDAYRYYKAKKTVV
ncbi:UPF0136 domain protein [Penicillium verhagenii]|uniref:UPF0136 domain protein n=1 Tax=Penicillium verhagenii TaxID=1562060 RepID=UPI002544F473|nr:UPF0136 domain protein [Penicillium verhagenii]KAJ5923961.1 UPF0136 domain protein [Penicillium verhagenii]